MSNQFDALQFNDFSKIRDFVDLVPDSLGVSFERSKKSNEVGYY